MIFISLFSRRHAAGRSTFIIMYNLRQPTNHYYGNVWIGMTYNLLMTSDTPYRCLEVLS